MSDEQKKQIEVNKEKFLNEIAQEEQDILENTSGGASCGDDCTCNESHCGSQIEK